MNTPINYLISMLHKYTHNEQWIAWSAKYSDKHFPNDNHPLHRNLKMWDSMKLSSYFLRSYWTWWCLSDVNALKSLRTSLINNERRRRTKLYDKRDSSYQRLTFYIYVGSFHDQHRLHMENFILIEVYFKKALKPRSKVKHHKREHYWDKTDQIKN